MAIVAGDLLGGGTKAATATDIERTAAVGAITGNASRQQEFDHAG